jgi:hypothetical protein
VTERFGDHCTKPIDLLFPALAFGCVLTAMVALTGLLEASSPMTNRNKTRGVAGQSTLVHRISPAWLTPSNDESPRWVMTTRFATEWHVLLRPKRVCLLLSPISPVALFGLPVVIDTFALPIWGLLAKAEICTVPRAVGHETLRTTRVSIRSLEAPAIDAP